MSATITTPARLEANPTTVEKNSRFLPQRSWWKVLFYQVPNLLVFLLLAGVMYHGHHTGWKIPKFSQLLGTNQEVAEDWCTEHLVAESACIECQADLLPKSKPVGFCRKHGVAECVIHHPELAQVQGTPQLPRYDTVRAISTMARSHNNSRNTLHTHRVQFATVDSIAKAGIDVDVVQEQSMVEAITANGELVFDPTRVGHLSSRVPGMVVAVHKTVGDRVAAGDILALVDAALVGQVKAQFLQAVVQLQQREISIKRMRSLASSGAVPQKSLLEAETALQEAEVALISSRQALENLGFVVPEGLEIQSAKSIAEELRFLGISTGYHTALNVSGKSANLIPIRAPHEGVLMKAEVVPGEVVDATTALFTVSDPRRMWLLLNVRQEDAGYVRLGLPVRFQLDHHGDTITGKITWISSSMDSSTRTLQVRVAVCNEDGSLRDKTFGTGQIILREEPYAIVVPRAAIQTTADASFVFVRDKNYFEEQSPKFFHVRQVRLGASAGDFVELLAGVLPGEVIASKGSNVLLAQLLRSNLGAGCGCHDH